MFGLSLPKLLLVVVIVLVVWYGFKWLGRVRRVQRNEPARRAFRFLFFGERPPPMAAEETVLCRACGAYVPEKAAASCGRQDCPFPA
jgi:uncharacterized protein